MTTDVWEGCFLPLCGYLDESHAHRGRHPSHQQGHPSLVVSLQCQTSISMATSPHPPGTCKPTCRSLSALTAKNAILSRERGNKKALSDFFFLLKGVISTKVAESLVSDPEYFIHHALQGATDKEHFYLRGWKSHKWVLGIPANTGPVFKKDSVYSLGARSTGLPITGMQKWQPFPFLSCVLCVCLVFRDKFLWVGLVFLELTL